jgi:hypothetical protein
VYIGGVYCVDCGGVRSLGRGAVSRGWCGMGASVRLMINSSVHFWSFCSGGNCVGSGGVEACCS